MKKLTKTISFAGHTEQSGILVFRLAIHTRIPAFYEIVYFCPVLSGFNPFEPGFVHCPVQNLFWTDKTQPW